MSEFISFSEIARRLHVGRQTATNLVREGVIPGGFVLYERRGAKRWAVRRVPYEKWERNRSRSCG